MMLVSFESWESHFPNDAKLSLWGAYHLEIRDLQNKVDKALMETMKIDQRLIIESIEVSEGFC